MEKGKIGVYVIADDWEGLYVDGVLISEDHRLDDPNAWVEWTNGFGIRSLVHILLSYYDMEELADYGNLPDNFKDFKDYETYKEQIG